MFSASIATQKEREHHFIRKELSRVLSSPGFAKNDRLSRFLRYIVERHLEGRDDEIKESLIGIEVFGRDPGYDPKLDSIVRTEAARLRARLLEFSISDTRRGGAAFEVPKGGYIPVFHDSGPSRGRSRLWIPVALVALLVVIAMGWWKTQGASAPARIAVLPLKNLSGDRANDYFSDGLTDEIINNLSQMEGLEVRSRTSSFAFRTKPRNLREMAKQLDVDYILEGSAVRAHDRVRIYARLVRVRDDVPIWSGTYDRTSTDVLAIQDEISGGIVNSLRLRLGRGRRRYETSVEAYDLYLHARALAQEPPPARFHSIQWFEQAIANDRSFAPAYAGLASDYAQRSIQFATSHDPDDLRKMRAAAEKAIQLDPLLAEAHDALGLIYAHDGQWTQAERSFRRAIELDRNRSATHDDFGTWFLWVLGRNDEAIEQLRLAMKSDPVAPRVRAHLGYILISAGRYDEAETICRKLLRGDSDGDLCRARALFGKGSVSEAIHVLADAANALSNREAQGFLGYFYAKAGHWKEAATMAAGGSRFPNEQALIFAGLGDKDRAFDALDRMTVLGPQRVGIHLNYPEVASALRGDPRLRALRRQLGLPLYDEGNTIRATSRKHFLSTLF